MQARERSLIGERDGEVSDFHEEIVVALSETRALWRGREHTRDEELINVYYIHLSLGFLARKNNRSRYV